MWTAGRYPAARPARADRARRNPPAGAESSTCAPASSNTRPVAPTLVQCRGRLRVNRGRQALVFLRTVVAMSPVLLCSLLSAGMRMPPLANGPMYPARPPPPTDCHRHLSHNKPRGAHGPAIPAVREPSGPQGLVQPTPGRSADRALPRRARRSPHRPRDHASIAMPSGDPLTFLSDMTNRRSWSAPSDAGQGARPAPLTLVAMSAWTRASQRGPSRHSSDWHSGLSCRWRAAGAG